MSFRLYGGPKIITLLHDAASPSSQRIMKLLQNRAQTIEEQQSSSGIASADVKSPAKEYLDRAASAASEEPPFTLEIIDRRRATADQWRTIANFLDRGAKRSQVEALKDEQGPFVVNWDDGKVAQTEAEAEQLLNSLKSGSTDEGTKKSKSGGCIIS